MKKIISFVVLMVLMLGLVSSASAAVPFSKTITNSADTLATDTTSRDGCIFGRLYVTSTTSSKNSIFYLEYAGTAVTTTYHDKTTSGRWMYYNQYLYKNSSVNLIARTDSSVSSAYIVGSFGAGCAANGGW